MTLRFHPRPGRGTGAPDTSTAAVGTASAALAKRGAGIVAALVVMAAGGLVGVLEAAPAAAGQVSTLKYACAFPLIGSQPAEGTMNSDIPTSIAVGALTPKFVVNVVATVGPLIAVGLRGIGATTVEGTIDAKAHVSAPQGSREVVVPVAVAKTAVPKSGPMSVKATGLTPQLVFSQPGNGIITIGDITLHLAPRKASGDLTGLGEIDVACTLDPGQNATLTAFTITGQAPQATIAPPTTTSGKPDATSPATTPARTADATTTGVTTLDPTAASGGASPSGIASSPPSDSTTPGATQAQGTPAGTTPGATPTVTIASSPAAASGLNTTAVLLVVLGILAAGAVAFSSRSWLKGRRSQNGD